MTTRLNTLADRVSGDPFGLQNYDNLQDDVNWLIGGGADIAALDAGNTVTVTTSYHKVTVVTGNIDSIADADGASAGQTVKLRFSNAQVIRSNGGGVGNIRSIHGDFPVPANQAVNFVYDGANWWAEPTSLSEVVETWASLVDIVSTTTESDLIGTQGSGWTVPALTLGATDAMEISIEGDITVANGTNPTTRFKLYLGGTVVIDTGAAGILGGVGTPHPFTSRILIAMRGAGNSYFARWKTIFGNPAGANNLTTGWGTQGFLSATPNGGTTIWTTNGDITLDMTAAQALRATFAWGTSSATNELRIRQAKARVL